MQRGPSETPCLAQLRRPFMTDTHNLPEKRYKKQDAAIYAPRTLPPGNLAHEQPSFSHLPPTLSYGCSTCLPGQPVRDLGISRYRGLRNLGLSTVSSITSRLYATETAEALAAAHTV